MEAIAGFSSEVVTVADDARAYIGYNELPSSVNAVVSNDDLLIEILLRLPALALFLFKSVSKRWLSLITTPDFILRYRSTNPNLHPPCGLFLHIEIPKRDRLKLEYDYMSFDNRIPSGRSNAFTIGSNASRNTDILQSCNGLLLCRNHFLFDKYYVCNPSINQYNMLPQQHTYYNDKVLDGTFGIRMVFDPAKSPHYKVIYAGSVRDGALNHSIQLQTYSTESISACWTREGNWSVCPDQFPVSRFYSFKNGIYWSGAIHWLNHQGELSEHFMLDAVNEHPVLTSIQLPVTSNGNVVHDSKLLDSCGCLLLLCREDANSQQLNIYEMRNRNSEWSMKYHVNLNDIRTPFPIKWSICFRIWCVVFGEREEDSFMVIELDGKVLRYKTMSKTVDTLIDLGSASPRESFLFIASFARCDPNF